MTFTEPPAWHQHAACAGTNPDLFFPGRGVPITDARRVCATCPVKAECLDYAITNGETIGVWGGTSERERRAMRSAIIGYVRPPRWTGGPDAQRTPSPPRACTWPGCEFVSSPSGTGSHMAAHRRKAQRSAA